MGPFWNTIVGIMLRMHRSLYQLGLLAFRVERLSLVGIDRVEVMIFDATLIVSWITAVLSR